MQKPTIQQVNPNNLNTDIRSIIVNYSLSHIVEVDEDDEGLTITIKQGEPISAEVVEEEPTDEPEESEVVREVSESEEEESDDDSMKG